MLSSGRQARPGEADCERRVRHQMEGTLMQHRLLFILAGPPSLL